MFNYEGDTIITGSKDNTCKIWRDSEVYKKKKWNPTNMQRLSPYDLNDLSFYFKLPGYNIIRVTFLD